VPITSIDTDPSALTLTAVGEYPVSVERLWEAWTDPRQLERFWGPPEWPATFTRHEVQVGGTSSYFMTGPNGEKNHGYWRFESVDPGRRFVISEGFAHPDGSPNTDFPGSTMEIVFEKTEDGARFVVTSTFASVEAMEKLVAMGMVEGLREALSQLDAILAA
jgi:uncharacterized protein YndB with AHSA1/START domain